MTGKPRILPSEGSMPTRLLLPLVLLALILSTAPARAAGPGPYLEAEGIGSWLNDSRNRTAEGTFNAEFQRERGWGLALGYDLAGAYPEIGSGRLELEAARRRPALKKLDFAEGKLPATGKVAIRSLMCNTIAEYHDPSPWVPYVALGVGYAEVAVSQVSAVGTPFIAASKDRVLAWQAGGGMGIELGDHLTLDVGYRYFATLQPQLQLADGSTFKMEVGSHNLLLGVRLKY
jgi:opacity protein-like surface antigen